MASKRCMNGGCGATSPAGEWRKGWALRSGGFATLCDKCGMAYEESVFCDLFHQKESGWRECLLCGKRVHCGCIASKSLLDLLDSGGVQCISCMKNSGYAFIPNEAIQEFFPQHSHSVPAIMSRCLKDEEMNDEIGLPQAGGSCRLQHVCTGHRIEEDTVSMGKVVQSGKSFEINEKSSVPLDKIESVNESLDHIKQEELALQIAEVGSSNATNQHHACIESSQVSQEDDGENAIMNSMICGSLMQAYSTISLENSNQNKITEAPPVAGTQLIALPLANETIDGSDRNKALSTFQQSERARHLLPKPRRAGLDVASEASKEILPHMRVARPPVEGRGRNQLLPRYWPRITDQELQQISGDSNSTIVPLFEKVLSASDAGRIGRLVLPKACAEAYFPPISQPEGLPLKIQDAKGKEWHFQFRFWPNNNSRMYVLEGVTPCIQSLQLQAGDTVTFSRMDPEGKFVMGFRKATNSLPLQDAFQIPSMANVALRKETYFSDFTGNLPIVSAYSGLLQSLKETADPHLSCSSEHLNSAEVNISWKKTDKHGGRVSEGSLQPLLIQETNKSRNIGVKSKRLHMDNEDALELKLSWEEAQDLLSPPPSSKPSIVVIEDHEFEEYEDAPVFGKKTIFTARISGEKDQWIQCDDCSRWRRLPVDILVSSKWTCAENTWDLERSSCSAPNELSERDLQIVLHQNTELKRQRAAISKQSSLELEIASLDPLATAAALSDMTGEASASSGATTTKHPRHRPGCTCIVCIQPPSGTGPKHNPKCTCNVCLTVKRRFKTLMMRKKQRQSETDAHKRLGSNWTNKDETEKLAIGKGRLDLNSQPDRDGELQADKAPSSSRMSMVSLLHVANLPLENYLKQNGLTSLVNERQVGTGSAAPQTRTGGESEEGAPAECCFVSGAQEEDSCSGEK